MAMHLKLFPPIKLATCLLVTNEYFSPSDFKISLLHTKMMKMTIGLRILNMSPIMTMAFVSAPKAANEITSQIQLTPIKRNSLENSLDLVINK